MDNRPGFNWLIGVVVLAVVAMVGVYTYNLGLAHGLAETSTPCACMRCSAT